MAGAARTPVLRVRAASPADGDAVVALVDTLERERGATGDVEGTAAAVRACIASAACDLLVADHEGDVVGYAAVHWIPFPMLHGTEGYVSDLVIRRDWRGRGVGTILLEGVEARAGVRGCRRLMLNNRMATEAFTRAFFAKTGFRQRTEFANFVKALRSGGG